MLKQAKVSAISAAVSLALGALATPVFAQQAGAQQLERVEVTGSRILSVNAASPAPIQVMTSADIAASGATNLQDLLLKSPVFGTPGISRTNSNFSTSAGGVATVDLRNLGADRTLLLVNGRRYVAGISGSATVDLNTIPTDFIERVEVMTGGASAAYGSDAVAGVVNLVLKKGFSGLMLDAQVGQSQKNDDKVKKFSATTGVSSADGRDNIMAHFSISQQGAVYSANRDRSAVDQLSQFALTGEASDIATVNRPAYSSFTPQGRFFYTGADGKPANYTYDPSGKEVPYTGALGFNRNAIRQTAIPTDRLLLAANGEKALNDSHSLFFESTYAATSTKTQIEPFAVDSTGGSNPIYSGGFYVPAEFMVNGKLTRNPLVPDYIYNLATDRDKDGAKDYNFTRRLSEIDNRGARAERDTFRILVGLKGDLSKTWNYEAYAAHGFTKEAQHSTGQVNAANFRNALEAVPDANGKAQCRDPLARAQGCVPINVFGKGSISPEAAKYVRADGSLMTKVEQTFAGATVSGEPFSLPAGQVGVALGAEYRKEKSRDEADALTQAGLNLGNARPITEGEFNVKEVFGEVRAPLLKDLPLVKALDANAAVRFGKYSTVGNVTSWNAGLDWALNSMFRVRGTTAVSTRAPNIGELFQGGNQTFPTGIADPCKGVTATSAGAKDDLCRKDPGVMQNIAANGKFTVVQPDSQSISGYDFGSTSLKAEKGKSNTLGVIFSPKGIEYLKNFSFTADYFDIKIDDAISTPGRQLTLNQCYAGVASYCKDVTRRPTALGALSAGSIALINQANINAGSRSTSGVDLTVSHAMKLADGQLNSRLAYTYLIKSSLIAKEGEAPDYSQGEVGASRNRWVLNVGYDRGAFAVQASVTYIGHAYLDDQSFSDTTDDNDNVIRTARENQKMFGEIKAKVYTDMQMSYKLGKGFQLYGGINNLLDTAPPAIVSGLPGNVTGTETDAGTYDAIGRRYYLGVRYNF